MYHLLNNKAYSSYLLKNGRVDVDRIGQARDQVVHSIRIFFTCPADQKVDEPLCYSKEK